MSTLKDFTGVTKITTNFSLSKLQEVAAWNAPAVSRAPHSGGASPATTSIRLGSDATIDRAEPCFITNAPAYTHHQVRWINASEGKGSKNTTERMVVVSSYPASILLLSRHRNVSFKGRALLLLRLTWIALVIWSTVSLVCLVSLRSVSYSLFWQ
jgi:hypothetical protein